MTKPLIAYIVPKNLPHDICHFYVKLFSICVKNCQMRTALWRRTHEFSEILVDNEVVFRNNCFKLLQISDFMLYRDSLLDKSLSKKIPVATQSGSADCDTKSTCSEAFRMWRVQTVTENIMDRPYAVIDEID